MTPTKADKENIKKRLVESLRDQKEIDKIIIFGSFLKEDEPGDIDLAIFQNSKENYIELSLRYRKMIRSVSKEIPVDVIPIMSAKSNDFIVNEIECGEVIFERGN